MNRKYNFVYDKATFIEHSQGNEAFSVFWTSEMRSKIVDTSIGEQLSVAREKLHGPVGFLLSTPVCYSEPSI